MARHRSETHPAAKTPRPPRRIHSESKGKLAEPSACPTCGSSYRKGRWTWEVAPPDARREVCPACERIAAHYPAGSIRVEGSFATAHRDEIVALFRNLESTERADHPLKRIMAIEDEESGFSVTVTDGKLAEAFGRALAKAYDGQLEQAPTTADKENLVRVRWTRETS